MYTNVKRFTKDEHKQTPQSKKVLGSRPFSQTHALQADLGQKAIIELNELFLTLTTSQPGGGG